MYSKLICIIFLARVANTRGCLSCKKSKLEEIVEEISSNDRSGKAEAKVLSFGFLGSDEEAKLQMLSPRLSRETSYETIVSNNHADLLQHIDTGEVSLRLHWDIPTSVSFHQVKSNDKICIKEMEDIGDTIQCKDWTAATEKVLEVMVHSSQFWSLKPYLLSLLAEVIPPNAVISYETLMHIGSSRSQSVVESAEVSPIQVICRLGFQNWSQSASFLPYYGDFSKVFLEILARDAILKLISRGADVNASHEVSVFTPLMLCAYGGFLKGVEVLLEYEAEVNIVNEIPDVEYRRNRNVRLPQVMHVTALSISIIEGYHEIEQILKRYGAKVDLGTVYDDVRNEQISEVFKYWIKGTFK